jgi:Flp pilus assembly protein TadB
MYLWIKKRERERERERERKRGNTRQHKALNEMQQKRNKKKKKKKKQKKNKKQKKKKKIGWFFFLFFFFFFFFFFLPDCWSDSLNFAFYMYFNLFIVANWVKYNISYSLYGEFTILCQYFISSKYESVYQLVYICSLRTRQEIKRK